MADANADAPVETRRSGNETVSILFTHLNDPRGVRALRSLVNGRRVPDEVVIADGGSQQKILVQYEALAKELPFPLRILYVPGSVAGSREQAWAQCKGETIAFFDADEVAGEHWLENLLRPLLGKDVDFAAGPTHGLGAGGSLERYHSQVDAWFYANFVAKDIVYAPMGNSAWRRYVFESLNAYDGHVFDTTLEHGGEDFDVNVRALKAGFKGRFVPNATLGHDYSGLRSVRRTLRKKYYYARAEFQVGRRHEVFFTQRGRPVPDKKPWHPIELLEPFVRRWAKLRSRA